jgi:ubiquinone/menaquinone biosynthesis C-methylase UbiE
MASTPTPAGSAPPAESPGTVIGNHTHKYTARNPAIRFLTERFVARLDALLGEIAASDKPVTTPLEVGAGEGVITLRLKQRFGAAVGLDLPDAGLRAEWRSRPGPFYVHGDAQRLPFRNDEFDLLVCVEVLEHQQDPRKGLRELARVSRRHLVLSVPREPIFRTCNLAAGRYLSDLGNTPGHLNHWSTGEFVRFVSEVASVRRVEKPFPWTIVWAELS